MCLARILSLIYIKDKGQKKKPIRSFGSDKEIMRPQVKMNRAKMEAYSKDKHTNVRVYGCPVHFNED